MKKLLAAAVCAIALGANARTITVTENKTEGVCTSLHFAFGASADGKTLGLYRGYGARDAGEGIEGWEHFERVATIPSDKAELDYAFPDGWNVSVFAVRHFLLEEEAPLAYDSRVEYLQSNGKEMVNTGVKATADTRFVLDLAVLSSFGSNSGAILGYRTNEDAANSFRLRYQFGANYVERPVWNYGTKGFSSITQGDTTKLIHNRCIVSNDVANLYVNDVLAYELNAEECGFTGSGSLGLFAERFNNTAESYTAAGKVRLWSAKFYEGETLKRDFIPAVKDGVPGLWDDENGTFYPNITTTAGAAFTTGPRIVNEVGETVCVSESATYANPQPSVSYVIRSSGMALHVFGTLHDVGSGSESADVYLAFARQGETLPAPTCVWSGWKDNYATRLNAMLPGLDPSTTYDYVIYTQNDGGRVAATVTGSFTTGALIEVAAGEDPVAAVNGAAAGAEVRIAEGTYVVTGTMAPKEGVAIVGQGAGAVLDADAVVDRRIVKSATTHNRLENLTFANARREATDGGATWGEHGAAVRMAPNGGNTIGSQYHWISNCVFRACTNVNKYAAGLMVEGAAKIVDCRFFDCKADAGALFVHSGADQTQVSHCRFERCVAGDSPAVGCWTYSSPDIRSSNAYGAVLDNCVIANNEGTGSGGGIGGKFPWVENCQFVDNTGVRGGAHYTDYPSEANVNGNPPFAYTNTFVNCRFVGNRATGEGGGVFHQNYGRSLTFRKCVFTGNTSAKGPSALHLAGGLLKMYDCTFVGNESEREDIPENNNNGMSAVVRTAGRCDYLRNVASNNVARFRAGVLYVGAGRSLIADSIFAFNEFKSEDAARDTWCAVVWTQGGAEGKPVCVRNCLFACNTNWCGYGAAASVYSDYQHWDNCTFVGNRCNTAPGNNVAAGFYNGAAQANSSHRNLLAVDNRNLKDDTLQNFYAWGMGPIAYSAEDGTQLSTDATHNLRSVTPRFANPAALDYTQRSKAAGRDKGLLLDWMTAEATDISGVTKRVINGIPDIGAFEYPLVPGMLLMVR